jgi:uncharacterized protein YndB with AHSA1/START domain
MDTHHAAMELALTRLIPAPPEEVFAAWTDPARIPAFWGPSGMTVTACEVELRAGGFQRITMRDAAGTEYPVATLIEGVDAPRHLRIRVPEEGGCGPLVGASADIAFLPDEAGTRIEIRWHHPTAEMRASHLAMGFEKGWGEMLDKLVAHVAQPAMPCPGMPGPAAEHGWLHRMLGTWSYEAECAGPPGGEPMRAKGVERVRSLGGHWVVGESEGECPGTGDAARMVITLGWDARTQRFRGSWVGSMMPHMFVYEGTLDADGRTLTLESEGPSFDGTGNALYRDVVELRSPDHRVLTSFVQAEGGEWTRIMSCEFRRQA